MTAIEKLDKLIGVIQDIRGNLGKYVQEALSGFEQELITMNRELILSGKDSYGNDRVPFYEDDLKANGGFFSSPQAAKNYLAWKQDIGMPATKKDRNISAPNLYIPIGSHHFIDEVTVDITADQILFKGETAYAQKIMDRYGLDGFGLMDDQWKEIIEKVLKDKIREKILLSLQ